MQLYPPLLRMRLRTLYNNPQVEQANSSLFGMVRHLHGRPRAHQGWDLSAPPGTEVFAVSPGKIVHVQRADHPNAYDHDASYGCHIILEFAADNLCWGADSSKYYAFYAHLDPEIFVFDDWQVSAGDVIAHTGRTGRIAKDLPPDQAHLHFEIRTVPATPRGLDYHLDPSLFLTIPLPEDESRLPEN
jgi:murein DD-endopeptidase MepM/ murein hydrolase activator NlpD